MYFQYDQNRHFYVYNELKFNYIVRIPPKRNTKTVGFTLYLLNIVTYGRYTYTYSQVIQFLNFFLVYVVLVNLYNKGKVVAEAKHYEKLGR